MSVLIGLTGPAGAGKDTVAQMIENAIPGRVFRYALASPIKDFLIEVFQIQKENLYGPSKKREEVQRIDLKEASDRLWTRGISHLASWGYDNAANRNHLFDWLAEIAKRRGENELKANVTPRYLAQTLGTDFGRKIDPAIWLNIAVAKLREAPEPVKIISDVRFNNEAALVRDAAAIIPMMRGRVWEIVPRNSRLTSLSHESERGVLHSLIDLKIPNFGSLDALRQTVREELDSLGLIDYSDSNNPLRY